MRQTISKALYKASEEAEFPEASILDANIQTQSYAKEKPHQSGRLDQWGNQYRGLRVYHIFLNGVNRSCFHELYESFFHKKELYWLLVFASERIWEVKTRITSMPERLAPNDTLQIGFKITERDITLRDT